MIIQKNERYTHWQWAACAWRKWCSAGGSAGLPLCPFPVDDLEMWYCLWEKNQRKYGLNLNAALFNSFWPSEEFCICHFAEVHLTWYWDFLLFCTVSGFFLPPRIHSSACMLNLTLFEMGLYLFGGMTVFHCTQLWSDPIIDLREKDKNTHVQETKGNHIKAGGREVDDV